MTGHAGQPGNSRAIASAQHGVHDKLGAVVVRHLGHPYRRPLADYSRAALDVALTAAQRFDARAPLILDAGCGVGESTVRIAAAHPDHFVIGVDQSADRLARGKDWWPGPLPQNLVWIRADLVDVWRLLVADRIAVAQHWLLYPNPWPKIGQLARRWHGHPVFPDLLNVCPRLELRSNWKIYCDEFAQALRLAHRRARFALEQIAVEAPALTPFERKYRASGQPLWRLAVDSME